MFAFYKVADSMKIIYFASLKITQSLDLVNMILPIKLISELPPQNYNVPFLISFSITNV